MSTRIDEKTYLKYLFQSLNLDELKQLCKDFEIKGYSKYKKADLIDYIMGSISDEEIQKFLENKELGIITEEIERALKIIGGQDRESIMDIRIKDPKTHEIEIDFKGFNWETSSYLSITKDNINDPERDCDCKTGSEGGLCPHYWVGFIVSLNQDYFELKDWKMTKLPKDFEEKIKTISISESISKGDEKAPRRAGKSVALVDESSAASMVSKFLDSRITAEGTIKEIVEREQDYQGHKTKYYVLKMEDLKVGPEIKKKSDYDESQIEDISNLSVRLSDKNYEKVSIKEGDKIKCSGRLEKDNLWGVLLKRTSKIIKI